MGSLVGIFTFAEFGVSWFSGKLLGPLDTGPLGLTGTWILLTLVENSLVFLRSGFSGWNFFYVLVRKLFPGLLLYS